MSAFYRDFGNYLYNRLPKVYHDYDVDIMRGGVVYKTLQEFLIGFAEGGFVPLIEDLEAIISLIDPMQCPEPFLPYLLKHFGLDYVEDIPVEFQRRLLQNILILYKKKGTIPAISFLARELSGFKVSITEGVEEGKNSVVIKLDAFEDEEAKLLIAQDIIERYIHLFLPTKCSYRFFTSYGFTEAIYFNGEAPVGEFDKASYEVVESMDEYINIIDNRTEQYGILEKCVEATNEKIRFDNGYADTENFAVFPFDVTTLTNQDVAMPFIYTNGISGVDKIIVNTQETIVYY